MMSDTPCRPDYIFEVSWEVCNKVGGIHTVLCTKARLLQQEWGDRLIMIGPDLHTDTGSNPAFIEDKNLFTTWKAHVQQEGLHVRTGRWNIPGQPIAILIDFTPFFLQKNEILTHLWVKFHLDSLNGQWDYIEPAMFGYAAGLAIAGFYRCHLNSTDKIIAQFHEWMTGAGILYLEENVPQIATVFTTHATVLGRTLAGNGQPFYSRFSTFNAEQAARDFNVVSKHSLEKTAATTADCFTCVSELTEKECEKFLDKRPDIITPNGFDPSFVPDAASFAGKRTAARQKILSVATALLQQPLADNALLLIKSGRYEFRNKGIDVFIDSLAELNNADTPDRDMVAFIFVPAHHTGPRKLLLDSLELPAPAQPRTGEVLTHNLQGADNDPILQRIRLRKLDNAPGKRVKIIFVPTYLNGNDGVFNLPYYDVLIGFDLAIFPSYYEPWGYTPLESLAFHIPAVTTGVSGFGTTVSRLPAYTGKGMYIIARSDDNAPAAAAAIATIIREYAALPETEIATMRESAAAISRQFLWEQLITRYYQAYDLALQKSLQREELFYTKPQAAPAETAGRRPEAPPVWRSLRVQPGLPPALQALQKISSNLWWSWNADAAGLFAAVDPLLWKQCGHNPLLLLKELSLTTIRRLEKDTSFLDMLARVSTAFDQHLQAADTNTPLIAYCGMEYGLHAGLKLYAGGLGVLAGDYLKAASDSNIHLVAIGLLYRQGYFKQKISPQGEQLALPDNIDMDSQPLYPVYNDKGEPLLVQLAFPGRTVHAGIWKIMAGRVPLYLLDTDVAANNAADRQITAQLYNGDPDLRLQQELLLGIGGVRMLAALGIQPAIYHINEGHAAFTALERIRELMHAAHLDFEEALEIVRNTTQFTTHTALPAAMDLFSEEQLRAYLSYMAQDLNITWEQVMSLGRADAHNSSELFSMMYLAARCSQEINGVSRLHRIISCRLLQPLWKDFRPAELHITHVTNGVHSPTWQAGRWQAFFNTEKQEVTDNELWSIRQSLKKDLVQAVKVRLRNSLVAVHESPENIREALDHLDEQTLFIGFARRFAPYKRAGLLFTDMDRLAGIINNSNRPVQVIFAGKAHPKDEQARSILKAVVNNSRTPALKHKVLFLEDYDMEMAAMMVQGVDVWLNTPQPGKEASGTSGMKAVLNGALHCSVQDGWWAEAYRADAGWALEEEVVYEHEALQDEQDAALLYSMLENEIIPLFFERNRDGVPEAWVKMIRSAMLEMAPAYSMQRVAAEYRTRYEQLYKRSEVLGADHYRAARELAAWKKKVRAAWSQLHVMAIEQPGSDRPVQTLGETFEARVLLYTGSLAAEDIGVEVVFSGKGSPDDYVMAAPLALSKVNGRRAAFTCSLPLTLTGAYTYSFRVFPKHPLLPHRQDFPLITWI
ncbi:alpha-glucan family phosphorylase [Chitinophaga japonensis]|uniref:glycogen phosphorylase n=1 Tax=Chitinophaga japonensis TaxID=104662 RepID=A0A562SSA0_CHIJA|nr:alpha-glucan family phosphorylase [Chitinophaga japonensis]TWI84137.1 phosphorylase/glycogen(starch) synthase [Chitinophaga japonensis]